MLEFSLAFQILTIICHGVDLLGFVWNSFTRTWMCISFLRLGKFSVISLNKFSIPFSSPGTPIVQIFVRLMLSKTALNQSFKKIIFAVQLVFSVTLSSDH